MKTPRWTYLRPGDIVDIVAPASHTSFEKLEKGMEWLKSIGLLPRIHEDIIKGDLFYASPLESQLKQFKKALYSDSKAIWCLRGGYGSIRLIPHLKKLTPPATPKLLIGYSDITSLHLYMNQEWNWPTLHGRNICNYSVENHKTPDRHEMKKIIFGNLSGNKTFKSLRPLNEAARKETSIHGRIIGGNLSILQSSMGTDCEFRPKGKILFMEDIGERGYKVARMLEQLKQAKLLDRGLRALLIGDFSEGEEDNGRDLTLVAIKRFAETVSYPVVCGMPCGHRPERNFALPLNTQCLLKTGSRITLECDYGGK